MGNKFIFVYNLQILYIIKPITYLLHLLYHFLLENKSPYLLIDVIIHFHLCLILFPNSKYYFHSVAFNLKYLFIVMNDTNVTTISEKGDKDGKGKVYIYYKC